MFWSKKSSGALVLSVLMGILCSFPVLASDSEKGREDLLIAEISPGQIPRQRRPSPAPVPPPVQRQRDAPRFVCKVNVSRFDPLMLGYESGDRFNFTFNWGNVSNVVADEVEVIIRFWAWDHRLKNWNLYRGGLPDTSPVTTYDYTNVEGNTGIRSRRLSREINLEKDLYAQYGGCVRLKDEPDWSRCKYKVTQEVRYRMDSETQRMPLHGVTGISASEWITSAECEKVVEWDFTLWDEPEYYGSFQLFVNYPGKDYRDFVLSTPDPQVCRNACVTDQRCVYWTYVRPNHGQGPQARCWLKDEHPLNRVLDSCCVSGNPYEDRH